MGSGVTYPTYGRGAGHGGIGRALSDRLLGPGASRSEIALALVPAGIAAVALPALAWAAGVPWSATQLGIAAILAADLVGGVTVNASAPARRFYFRPGRTMAHHLGFVALHTVHVLVFVWLFAAGTWGLAMAISAALLLAAAVIRVAPIHLRRSVAMLALITALVTTSAVAVAPGMEWFIPVLTLKLLVSYLLGDVPAAPASGGDAGNEPIPPPTVVGNVHAG